MFRSVVQLLGIYRLIQKQGILFQHRSHVIILAVLGTPGFGQSFQKERPAAVLVHPEIIINTQALLEAKQAELARLQKKMDAYIEMRAEGDLSREMFRMKCAELEPKMQKLQDEIEKLSAESKPKEVVDYTEKLTVLQYALEQYTHRDEGQDVPECVVEAFVTRIVVSRDGFDWYLRFDGGPDKPLHCQLDGKRKQTTKIMVSGDISPTMDHSDTGRDSRSTVISPILGDPLYSIDAPSE